MLQAQQVADELNQSHEIKALAIKGDVASEADVRWSIEQTVQQFGDLHILVNNAGVLGFSQLHECEQSEWNRVMDVNVKSAYLSFKAGYPYLRKHVQSYVVSVASISSFVGQADNARLYHCQACAAGIDSVNCPGLCGSRNSL